MARKTRTREHIIADYSGIHFERYALDCGYSVERITHDYGIDLLMFTYNERGEIENEEVKVQLKATDAPKHLQTSNDISFVVECADLEMWLGELMPVILVLYDASQDTAYWLHIQAYFENQDVGVLTTGGTKTFRISKADVLNADAVRRFAQWKNKKYQLLWRLSENA